MYKEDVALNSLQLLICHKTKRKPNDPNLAKRDYFVDFCLSTDLQVLFLMRENKYFFRCRWIFLEYMYLPNPSALVAYDTRSICFLAEFNRFQLRVFLLEDWLPHQGWRTQYAQLFTYWWRENNWIRTCPKNISAISIGYRDWTDRLIKIASILFDEI